MEVCCQQCSWVHFYCLVFVYSITHILIHLQEVHGEWRRQMVLSRSRTPNWMGRPCPSNTCCVGGIHRWIQRFGLFFVPMSETLYIPTQTSFIGEGKMCKNNHVAVFGVEIEDLVKLTTNEGDVFSLPVCMFDLCINFCLSLYRNRRWEKVSRSRRLYPWENQRIDDGCETEDVLGHHRSEEIWIPIY